MASEGLWDAVCEVAHAATDSVKQWLAPTKSQDEIQLNQNLREAKVGNDLSAELEKLAAHDRTKVAQGYSMLSELKSGKFENTNSASADTNTNKNGNGKS